MEQFSLSWFNTQKENKIQQSLRQQVGISAPIAQSTLETNFNEKPYLSIKLVNDVLTIIFRDGSIVSKSDATITDFANVKLAKTEVEIIGLITNRIVDKDVSESDNKIKRLALVGQGIETLKQCSDFVIKDGSVYLKGLNRSLPGLLIEKFATIIDSYRFNSKPLSMSLAVDDEYIGLKRFFMWACLNPRAEVADKLYDFLDRNGMKITKQGFFVALRNVVEVKGSHKNHKVVDAITNAYNKVKAVWKKDPATYEMYKTYDGYTIRSVKDNSGEESIGNLKQLYLDLPNMQENHYTDAWTHSFDIRIGKVVNMPMENCNWSTQDCAASGLHFAGYTAPYVLCGDTTVFTLHNPMKVVGIGVEKGRCYEYLPFMTTTVAEADAIMNDGEFDFLQLDEEYAIRELQSLEEKVRNGITIESKKYEFNIPGMSTSEIKGIIKSLDSMKLEISKRVNIIY